MKPTRFGLGWYVTHLLHELGAEDGVRVREQHARQDARLQQLKRGLRPQGFGVIEEPPLNQSEEGREHIAVVRTNRRREESILL